MSCSIFTTVTLLYLATGVVTYIGSVEALRTGIAADTVRSLIFLDSNRIS